MTVDDGGTQVPSVGGVERLERGDELTGAFAGRPPRHGFEDRLAVHEQAESWFGIGRWRRLDAQVVLGPVEARPGRRRGVCPRGRQIDARTQIGQKRREHLLTALAERVRPLRDDAVVDDAREVDPSRLVGGSITETTGVGVRVPWLPVSSQVDHVRPTAVTDERRVGECHVRIDPLAHPNPAVATVGRPPKVAPAGVTASDWTHTHDSRSDEHNRFPARRTGVGREP